MTSPISKIKRTFDFHYYRIKNHWTFPSNMAHVSGARIAKGTHESGTTSLVKKHLVRGSVFLDIGANVGYYSRLASGIVDNSGKVYAFEVEPANFYALNKNTEFCPNVIPLNFAVSNENSFLKINHSSHSTCHSVIESANHLDGSQFITPTITLDKFWSLYLDKANIDVIKIDVEGAEPLVLEGMRNVLTQHKVDIMIIEYCPKLLINAKKNPDHVFNLLSPYFSISVIKNKFQNIPDGFKISNYKKFNRLTKFLLDLKGAQKINLFCST